MKTLTKFINEKLIINKDYNYTKEKNIFEKMMNGLINVSMH